MDISSASVTDIQFIGPVTAKKLKSLSVFSIADLLLASNHKIHSVVSDVASAEEVKMWRQMATLLEIRGMTPQWAEALVKGGLPRVERIFLSDLAELQKIFRAAKRKKLIPESPKADEIAQIQKDAAILHHTGKLIGRVCDENSKPIANVYVNHGQISGKTDKRGRFRLARLPLHKKPALVVKHTGFYSAVMDTPQISFTEDVLKPNKIALKRLESKNISREINRLSEFYGDRLPPVSGQAVRTNRKKIGDQAEGDIVQYRRDYADGKTIELVSRFRNYVDGEFVIDTYRVSRKLLPASSSLRDHFKLVNGEYNGINMRPKRHQYELAYRRLLKAKPNLKRPKTQKQFSKLQKDIQRHMD